MTKTEKFLALALIAVAVVKKPLTVKVVRQELDPLPIVGTETEKERQDEELYQYLTDRDTALYGLRPA